MQFGANDRRYDGSGRTASLHQNSSNHRGDIGGILGADNTMLCVVLTSLVALYVGMSRFNMTVYIEHSSKPWAFGLLVVLAVRQIIQFGKSQVGSLVENCTQRVDDVMTRVSSSSTLTRIKSSVSASSMRLMDLATGRCGDSGGDKLGENRLENRVPKIAVQHAPFLSLDSTKELSLSNIKNLFRYALEVNRNDFDTTAFRSKLSSKCCRDAIDSMDRAVLESRGSTSVLSLPPVRESKSEASDMDVLYFVAVVCIFAEWRSVRLVPPGHHRYSIGMGLAKRDLIQNAQKMETAVHHYISSQEQKRCGLSFQHNEDKQEQRQRLVRASNLEQFVL
jgi:hypothetical protein